MRAYLARCTDPTGFYDSRELTYKGHWAHDPVWYDFRDSEHEESPRWTCGIQALKECLEWYKEYPQGVALFLSVEDGFFGTLSSDLSSQDFDAKPNLALPYIAALLSGKYAALCTGRAWHLGFSLPTWKLVLSDTPLPPGTSFTGLRQTEQVEWTVLQCIKSDQLTFIEVPPSEAIAQISSASPNSAQTPLTP